MYNYIYIIGNVDILTSTIVICSSKGRSLCFHLGSTQLTFPNLCRRRAPRLSSFVSRVPAPTESGLGLLRVTRVYCTVPPPFLRSSDDTSGVL